MPWGPICTFKADGRRRDHNIGHLISSFAIEGTQVNTFQQLVIGTVCDVSLPAGRRPKPDRALTPFPFTNPNPKILNHIFGPFLAPHLNRLVCDAELVVDLAFCGSAGTCLLNPSFFFFPLTFRASPRYLVFLDNFRIDLCIFWGSQFVLNPIFRSYWRTFGSFHVIAAVRPRTLEDRFP